MSRFANSPSLVNSIKPAVLISNRPTAIQRSPSIRGSRSNTVRRPSGSLRVLNSPSGLLYIITRQILSAFSSIFTVWPSTRIESVSSTRSPNLATLPLTLTRFASMYFSISRREPTPARARTFCNFSPCITLIRMVLSQKDHLITG